MSDSLPSGHKGVKVKIGSENHVEINGVDVSESVRSVSFSAAPSDVPLVQLELVAFDVEADYEKTEPVVESSPATEPPEVILREGKKAKVRLINPGWGSSGYYSESVLASDGPIAFPSGTHMYVNHQTEDEAATRPERDIRDLAAVTTSEAKFENDPLHGPGLYAEANVFSGHEGLIEKSEVTGLSIFASGYGRDGSAEGKDGLIVERLLPHEGNSIDFVTKAGRGGKLVSVMESVRIPGPAPVARAKEENAMAQEKPIEAQEAAPVVDRLTEKALTGRLKVMEDTLQTLKESLKAQKQENEKLREANLYRDARDAVLACLEERCSALGRRARNAIASRIAGDPPVKEGAIDVDILVGLVDAEERDYMAMIQETAGIGGVRNMGMPASTEENVDKLKESVAARFASLGLSSGGASIAAQGRIN